MKKILELILTFALCAVMTFSLVSCFWEEPDNHPGGSENNDNETEDNENDDNKTDETEPGDIESGDNIAHTHTPSEAVEENVTDSTCYAEGKKDVVVYCSDSECHAEISRKTEKIEKKQHTPAEAVVENEVKPTCTKEGSYDEVIYCAGCQKYEISREKITINLKDHSYKEGICESCGKKEYSQGLAFASKGDGTCYVIGIGSCTDADVVIPPVAPNGDSVIGIMGFELCDQLTSIVIPDSVKEISSWTFELCGNLTSVVIGNNVEYIGDVAFKDCYNLTSIVIPDSVTSIGGGAFYSCSRLTNVVIGGNAESLGYGVFEECDSLTCIEVDENNATYKSIDGNLYTKDGKTLVQYAIGKSDTSFTIPYGVECIGDYAFSSCNSLTSIVIPDSVTSIGEWTFSWCDSLTDVYYTGTESEWAGIAVKSGNEKLTGANIHYSYIPEE